MGTEKRERNGKLSPSRLRLSWLTCAALGIFVWSQPAALAQALPAFTKMIVFGDSLSDDGNIAHRARNTVGFSYPSSNFNYSDYRFTNDFNTSPSTNLYSGVWHEQLARTFLGLPRATNSLDGGFDYAFGGATTKNGTQQRTILNNPTPFGGGDYTLTIDNMGRQISDFLATRVADPAALYVVWGGGNDLFDDRSAANVTATVNQVGSLITRLANAGARYFLVPNVPPLGAVPNSFGEPEKVAALNLACKNYRDQLNGVLAATRATFASNGIAIQIYTLDVWLDLIRLLAQPRNYGFVNVTSPAQGEPINPDNYLFWDDLHPTTAGHHQLASEANRLLRGQIASLGKATNVSTRGLVGTGQNVLIGGFIVTGPAPKKMIVRAIGPSLASAGLSGLLADPTLAIYNGSNTLIAINDNWKSSQQAEIMATGLAPQNDLESAVILTLAPGSYTAVVSGKSGATGIALVDVYDLDTAANSIFRNVSTRGFVGTGDNVLIGGLTIGAGEPPVIIVRAIGPTLASYGITQPLLNPTLQLFNANGTVIASNDDWKDQRATAIKATLLAPPNDRESTIVMSLGAGRYTAIVRGKDNTTGVALVEAYRLQ
jgi:phospholipase/lecithinase/hemolysin